MIRILTAALLFSSFHAVAQTQVPNVFEDGTPASAAEVNANFDALETAIDAIPEGPAGPQGEQGPAGADGRDAVGGFSHSWTFNAGNQGYGQFSTGAFVARADSDYTSNKYGVTELWINLQDSESNTIGTGPSTAGGADATGFFSFFDAGDLVSLKNIEDSGDSVIYRLTAKPQWEYTPTYASYVVLTVDPNSPAIIGSTGFTSDSTYAIDFTKNGILSGLSCTTDQVIVYRGGAWVCTSLEVINQYAGFSSYHEAVCPSGKIATGGSCYFDGEGCNKIYDYPSADGKGWVCDVRDSSSCVVIYAHATCL